MRRRKGGEERSGAEGTGGIDLLCPTTLSIPAHKTRHDNGMTATFWTTFWTFTFWRRLPRLIDPTGTFGAQVGGCDLHHDKELRAHK
jgi:hypothetical protein